MALMAWTLWKHDTPEETPWLFVSILAKALVGVPGYEQKVLVSIE